MPEHEGTPCELRVEASDDTPGDGNASIAVHVIASEHKNDGHFQIALYLVSTGELITNGGGTTNSYGGVDWGVGILESYNGQQMKIVFGFPGDTCDTSPHTFTYQY